MGGNAFDLAERITPREYDEICGELLWFLGQKLNYKVDFAIPKSVRDKESHGDVDILVTGPDIEIAEKLIDNAFSVLDRIKSPSGFNLLVNFEGKHIQVDLSKVGVNELEFATNYFSWNDLGNLIGRIAHRQGLKFGHDGLWYVYKDGDQQLGMILLTRDFEAAIEYLGFDVQGYRNGFDSFEQMFLWVKACKHFDPHGYPLEHRNHAARTRDKKRKTYMAFLKWLNFTDEYVASDKPGWLQKHVRHFPDLQVEIDRLTALAEIARLCKAKLNGAIVRDLTGLEGKELGQLMQKVNGLIPREKVLQYSSDTIEAGIRFAHLIHQSEKMSISMNGSPHC